MEDNRLLMTYEHLCENGERKYPNALKDVKRKLSFINKNIGDLHRQRKFSYKNSSKVKKIIHYQVNQIVKCLRARERNLWADIDEAYLSQDASISDELSKLQSIHSRCQVLFNHLDYIKGNIDVWGKMYSILSEVNFGENPDVKPLEFISDFEAMKTNANYFGSLDGDFVKKNESVLIDNADKNSSDTVYKEFQDKEDCLEKTVSLTDVETEACNSYLDKLHCKQDGSEDSFEIVDLLQNMCCEEFDKDIIMAEQENPGDCIQQNEEYVVNCSSGNESKLVIVCSSLENSHETLKSDDFNPEEEWRQIFEMKSKIADLHGMTSKLSDENKKCETEMIVNDDLNTDKICDKSCKEKNTFLKEYENWLRDYFPEGYMTLVKNRNQSKALSLEKADHSLHNSLKCVPLEEEIRCVESINIGTNVCVASPAELIQQAFTEYLSKENIESWLLSK